MINHFDTSKYERYAPIIIFALGFFLFLPGIWSETGVTAKDEFWLSLRTPLETLARGEWLTPWVNGEPRLRKPPLLYWAIMASYKTFGINLFAARIWGVLAGAGLALCSCLISRRLFAKDGLLAGLLTTAAIGVAIEARQAMLDLPLACLVSFAIYFGICWWKTNRIIYILAASFSLGLSFLVKGPIGFYFFTAAAATGLFLFAKWRDIASRAPHIVCGLVLLLAICLPWPLIMAHLWPNFSQVLGEEASRRHFGRVDLFSPFSALGGALGLVFPWTLVLLAAIVETLGRVRRNPERKNFWLVLWYAASVIPLFFMESFERYMLPLIPAMCILSANWLEAYQSDGRIVEQVEAPNGRSFDEERQNNRIRKFVLQGSVLLVAFAAVLLCCFFLWFGIGVRTAMICLSLTGIMLASVFLTRSPHAVVLSVALLFAALMGEMYPMLGISSIPEGIEKIVADRPAAVYATSEPAMLSMRLKRSVVPLDMQAPRGAHSLHGFDGFVFMEALDAPKFEAAARDLPVVFTKEGSFPTFYSRKVWIRFTRRDATLDDWLQAARARSLEDLKAGIVFYRVYPRENHP